MSQLLKNELTIEIRSDILKKLTGYVRKVSTKNANDLGKCEIVKHLIEVENIRPIYIAPYKVSQTEDVRLVILED